MLSLLSDRNRDMLDDLLCPQQASGGTGGDQIMIRHRRLIDIKALPLITGSNHFKESHSITGMGALIQ